MVTKTIFSLLLLVIIFAAKAQESPYIQLYPIMGDPHPLEALKTNDDRSPKEFQLLLEHLKIVQHSKKRLNLIRDRLLNIDKNLQGQKKATILFFLKSEIYKAIFDNGQTSQFTQTQIFVSHIDQIKQKLKKHSVVYGPFTSWLINSIIEDFTPYLANNFIDNYQTHLSNPQHRIKALELQKVLKYLSPWVILFIEKIPEDFNQLLTKIIMELLINLETKSWFFKQFTPQYSNTPQAPLFHVPEIKLPELAKLPQAPLEGAIESLPTEKQLDQDKALDNLVKQDEENPWVPK